MKELDQDDSEMREVEKTLELKHESGDRSSNMSFKKALESD